MASFFHSIVGGIDHRGVWYVVLGEVNDVHGG